VLPASENATHVIGGIVGSPSPDSESERAVRAAIEELMRRVITQQQQSRVP
jgi:hypothetical protein